MGLERVKQDFTSYLVAAISDIEKIENEDDLINFTKSLHNHVVSLYSMQTAIKLARMTANDDPDLDKQLTATTISTLATSLTTLAARMQECANLEDVQRHLRATIEFMKGASVGIDETPDTSAIN